jgi:hypothetical protein
MSKIFRRIKLQDGSTRFYRDDILEEKNGRVVYYTEMPEGGLLKESNGARFDDVEQIDESPIRRNNGTRVVTESGKTEDRIQRAMRLHKMSFREASIFCGEADPGPSSKTPAAFTESLVKAWKDYCGGLISEADCRTLAERGISPE